MFLFFDSLVDMGITPHIPTQNRTCAINAYGFSLYISYSTCKTNLLICAYYIKITFLVSYVSFKVIKKGNQHIVDYLLDYLFKLVKREKLTTLHFQWLCELSDTGDERIELPPKVLETPIIPFDQSPIFNFKVCTFKTTHKLSFFYSNNFLRSSFRPISNSQLHTSLCFHPCPIYLIVSKGSLTLSSLDISS